MKSVLRLLMLALLLSGTILAQTTYSFQTVDVPGQSNTQVRGINNLGTTVGIYTDSNTGLYRGFERDSNGGFKHIDFPGGGASKQTYPRSINKAGQVVGFVIDSAGVIHGFLLGSGGFKQLDYPGSVATAARGLNDRGQIVGDWGDVNNVNIHGYVYSQRQFASFDFPGAIATTCFGINNAGERVGAYTKDNVNTYSFLLRNGTFKSFRVPGSTDTEILAVNNYGVAVGFYFDSSSGTNHGFILSNGTMTHVDVPGSRSTLVRGINDAGVIVGNYGDAGFVDHGFIGIPQ